MRASKTRLAAANGRAWRLAGCLTLAAILFYCMVPFETRNEGLAIGIRGSAAAAIVAWILVRHPPKLNETGSRLLMVVWLFALLANFNSSSSRAVIFAVSTSFGLVVAAAWTSSKRFREVFEEAMALVLLVSGGALVVQLSVWKLTGDVLNLHELVFPLSEARTEDHFAFARLGGLYIEPGTYANWIYVFLLIYLMSARKPAWPVCFLIVATIALTFSLWGVGVASLCAAVLLLQTFRQLRIGYLISSVCAVAGVIAVIGVDGLAFFETKAQLETTSGESKLDAIGEFQSMIWRIMLIGRGFNAHFCPSCAAPQDSGLFINLSVVLGLIPTVTLFALLAFRTWQRWGWSGLAMGLPLAFAKLYYWDFAFWVVVFGVVCWKREPEAQRLQRSWLHGDTLSRRLHKGML